MLLFVAPLRALAQLDDGAMLAVLWRSVLLTVVGFALVALVLGLAGQSLLTGQAPWLDWTVGVLGTFGVLLLAHYLFLPVAAVVASLFSDRIAEAVERRYYPDLPPAAPAPLVTQAWDGLALGLRVLLWQVVALAFALIPPLVPIATPLGWAIAAWAMGRGLFVTVAMRRMDRAAAIACYRAARPAVMLQGLLLALLSLVPVANLLVPVLGIAVMVHLLHADDASAQAPAGARRRS
jgi:CysZ protein